MDNVKGDMIRRYCYPFKRILLIEDERREDRCKKAVNVWRKLLSKYEYNNSFFVSDTMLDFLWIWFINIAGAC